ncbi:MAG TPA: hypothetical protein PKN33_00535 [Phycisphaerae bacterium]|nr:hypothetical protein [Phycisphaerae bacterium]
MNTQQLLLRIMLWSLAIAGGLGIVAVAFVESSWTWQVVGTGFFTAIACALLIPTSALAEKPSFKIAGFASMFVVLFEYLAMLTLIWQLDRLLGEYRTEEQVGLTMLFVALATLLIVGLLWASHTRFGKAAAWCGVGVVVLTFIMTEVAVWLGYRSSYDDEWGMMAATFFFLLGLSVLCFAGNDELAPRRWRFIGVVSGSAAFVFAFFEIWHLARGKPAETFIANLTILTAMIAHANLACFCRLKTDQLWVRKISIGATAATGIILALIFTDEIMRWHAIDDDAYGRLAAATGIAASFATIALCVLWRMNARAEKVAASSGSTSEHLGKIELTCPRCKIKQSLNPGKSQCAHCELKFEINFEEPRCTKCEYLLVGLTGEACPECGHMIAAIS